MDRRIGQCLAVLMIAGASASGSVLAAGAKPGVIPGQYIIKLAPNFKAADAASSVASAHGVETRHVYSHALNGFAGKVPAGRLNALRNDPRVLSIVEDQFVSIHECFDDPDCGSAPPPPPPSNQTIPTGITRSKADQSSTQSGNGSGSVNVDIAILDTGIASHQDLNLVGGYNCSQGSPGDYADRHGHGTHVAGTAAAIDDGDSVVGVAPGARLWAVKVLSDSGSGSFSDVICGIDWVTQNASTIEVANMSLGGPGGEGFCTDGGMREAICNSVSAGVTYAVAAGNSSTSASNSVPATFPEVVTVSALADFDGQPGGAGSPTCRFDQDDTFADFSNYGSDVDIIAPGVCIESTVPGGGTQEFSGTSMASPHVAGAAALYISNNPGVSPSVVRSVLISSGNYNWNNSDDPDGIKEPLLDVSSF